MAGLLTGERTRSPHWRRTEKEYLKTNPSCKACGKGVRLNVHHKKPYHLHPELELDTSNLIGLCMSPLECHLRIGHGDNFRAYNPNVEADAAAALADPSRMAVIVANAKATRLLE